MGSRYDGDGVIVESNGNEMSCRPTILGISLLSSCGDGQALDETQRRDVRRRWTTIELGDFMAVELRYGRSQRES